jgi:hypothetical protein
MFPGYYSTVCRAVGPGRVYFRDITVLYVGPGRVCFRDITVLYVGPG